MWLNEFKKGDFVVCVDNMFSTLLIDNKYESLKKLGYYTIEQVEGDVVYLKGFCGAWNFQRFSKISLKEIRKRKLDVLYNSRKTV